MTGEFRQNPVNKKWVIVATERAKRPDVAKGAEPPCPFCYGHERMTPPEIFRLGGGKPNEPGWKIRVIPNLYAITEIHEIIIHSPEHRKNFIDLPQEHIELIIKAYKNRYLANREKGQVFIFNNHGRDGAESLPHPHTQIAVVPKSIPLACQRLGEPSNIAFETGFFTVFCPETSEWPYETWISPKRRGAEFGEINEAEIKEFSGLLKKILIHLGSKLDGEFSFNFFIYPGGDWYWRLIPRNIIRGGFELGTGIMVNIIDPKEAVQFLKEI